MTHNSTPFVLVCLFLAATSCKPPSTEQKHSETAPLADGDAEQAPAIQDTAAWIDWYNPQGEFHGETVAYLNCDSTRAANRQEVTAYVQSDTVFDLKSIDPKMTGKLAFTWEPLENDTYEDDGWNMNGVHAFKVYKDADTVQIEDLEEILAVEAWVFRDGDVLDAKEVKFLDINLDGYLDMRMKQFSGKTTWYCFYLFDPTSGSFSLQRIDSVTHVTVNCEKGLLYSYAGGSGSSTSWKTWEINPKSGTIDPILTEYWALKEAWDDEGKRFFWKSREFIDNRDDSRQVLQFDSTFVEYDERQ